MRKEGPWGSHDLLLDDEHTPADLQRFGAWDPELLDWYLTFREQVLAKGALPQSIKLLMASAVVTAQRAPEAVVAYTRLARESGALENEIREALRVGALFSGGPGILAAAAVIHVVDT